MNPESSRPVSTQRLPAHVQAMLSAFNTKPADSSSNNKCSDSDTAVTEDPKPAPVHPEFAFADGNIEIQTTDQTFWVHEYHLNKFAGFATLIQAAKNSASSDPGRRIVVTCDKKTKGEDICNTLKVIYASHIDGIPDFDSNTMTSALRIASTFDYPSLRKFAISKLEGMNLSPIQRIQLSDELSLPTWETPAFTELCSRKEPISKAEAEVLGMTRFVEVARIRETEQTRLAIKFAGGIYGELLQASELVSSLKVGGSDGSGSVKNTFEYSSGHSVLPRCTCRVSGTFGSFFVDHCGLHQATPQVLQEGQTLLKQRDELLKLLRSIQSTVNCPLERENSPSKFDGPDLKTELSRASWIRRDCAAAS